MRAIITRYLGPTNYRGSRIKARCDAGTITVPYPYEARMGEDVHRIAAEALRDKLGWTGRLVGGAFPDSDRDGYAFVFVPAEAIPSCAACGAPMLGLVRIHHHSEDGRDVTS